MLSCKLITCHKLMSSALQYIRLVTVSGCEQVDMMAILTLHSLNNCHGCNISQLAPSISTLLINLSKHNDPQITRKRKMMLTYLTFVILICQEITSPKLQNSLSDLVSSSSVQFCKSLLGHLHCFEGIEPVGLSLEV